MTNPSGLITGVDGLRYCYWCDGDDLYRHYHDTEWGWPVFNDRGLFEKLSLEVFQCGLSWLTVLRKRQALRDAFSDFDFTRIWRYDSGDIAVMLDNSRIIRNRAKITAIIHNAGLVQSLKNGYGSLTNYFWRFAPTNHQRPSSKNGLYRQTTCPEAEGLARDLKTKGWKFLGPITCYAFMQAMGLVNDHFIGCTSGDKIAQSRSPGGQAKSPGG